jgi:HTH-type transcriptional regulator/antitoxin HigA
MTTIHKNIIPHIATHPGILIRDEIDARPDLNQKELAKELGVKPSFLNEIIKGKRPVTADLAILLEQVLEISAEYWLKFQSQYEIDKARIKEKNINRLKNIEIWKVIKEYVPVSYFRKNAYLNDTIQDDIQVIKKIYNVSNVDELVSSYAKSKVEFYRKSDKLQIDNKNKFAWTSLAYYEARNQNVDTFSFENIDDLCKELNTIFFENNNTITKTQSLLKQYGIKLVLISKLDKTPIDGFSFWSENKPAIALTLRHKRIDNFAFTLMHEIAHIDLHLRNNKNKSFMDFNSKNNPNNVEKEADQYAQEKLITRELWDTILKNGFPVNDNRILEIAEEHNTNPAIILGRISYETNNYAIKTKIDKKLR